MPKEWQTLDEWMAEIRKDLIQFHKHVIDNLEDYRKLSHIDWDEQFEAWRNLNAQN